MYEDDLMDYFGCEHDVDFEMDDYDDYLDEPPYPAFTDYWPADDEEEF